MGTPEYPGYDEGAATQSMMRERIHGGPDPYGPGAGYGYGPPGWYGYGRPRWQRGPGFGSRFGGSDAGETKPFFLTSEFVLGLIAVVALLITVAANDDLGARFFWIWTSVILAAYMVSRGIAKAGSRSRSYDPRDDLSQMMRRDEAHEQTRS